MISTAELATVAVCTSSTADLALIVAKTWWFCFVLVESFSTSTSKVSAVERFISFDKYGAFQCGIDSIPDGRVANSLIDCRLMKANVKRPY